MYEKEILEELREMNRRLAKIEEMLTTSRDYGGCKFSECMTRIMYGAEE